MLRGFLVGLTLCLVSSLAYTAEIKVDPKKENQTIEGFGSSATTTGNIGKWMAGPEAAKLFAGELGATCLRISLRSHDIPKQEDPEKLSYRDMVVGERTSGCLPFFKRLLKVNPDMRLIATAWTPPAWMKVNNSERGHPFIPGGKRQASSINGDSYQNRVKKGDDDNRVDPKYYPHLAKWCAEVIRYYKHNGVDMYGISFGNEVCFSQFFGSCVWTADDYAKMVKLVGERLKKEKLDYVKIYGPETMSHRDKRSDMYLKAMKKNGAIKYLYALATHGYVNGVKGEISDTSSAKQWDLAKKYGVVYWMTEGGTGGHNWPKPLQSGIGSALHCALVAGNASLFTSWQFVDARPTEHNLSLPSGPTKKTWTAAQYFRFVRPGMVRVDADSGDKNLLVSAYKSKKELVIVVMNMGNQPTTTKLNIKGGASAKVKVVRTSATEDFAEQPEIKVSKGKAEVEFPALSITTMVLTK